MELLHLLHVLVLQILQSVEIILNSIPGANSLKINKTAAAGTGAQVTILVPVRDYLSQHTGRLWYRNVAGGSGSFIIEFGYYTIIYDTNGIPVVKDKALTINQTVSLTGVIQIGLILNLLYLIRKLTVVLLMLALELMLITWVLVLYF